MLKKESFKYINDINIFADCLKNYGLYLENRRTL